MSEDQILLSGETPTPPPPPPSSAPKSAPFDLGALFGFAFRDPRSLSKFLIGCFAVVLIPLFGLGLVALLGFLVGTARGALRGDEHPMPEWDDPGGLLLDGLKVLGVILAYAAAAAVVGLTLLGFTVFWVGIGKSMGSAAVTVASVFGVLVSVIFLMLLVLFAKAVLPAGILQLAATGQFGAAFRINESLAMVRANSSTYLCLLLTLILFSVLADATVLLCFVGVIPGAFWGFAASGAAIGHAGRSMGVKARSPVL